jgi:predicted MPP superfamily phosphohydrolase
VFGSNDYYSGRVVNPLAYPARRLADSLAGRRAAPRSGDGSAGTGRHVPDLPTAQLRAALLRGGWQDLNNARGRFRFPGVTLRLVGLDDPHIGRDRLPAAPAVPSPGPLLPAGHAPRAHHAAAARPGDNPGSASEPPDVCLGIVHAPYRRALRALAGAGARLILAGHTHGGQVCLPGHGALVSNCDLPPALASGLHHWPLGAEPGAQVWLHVSAGLGTSQYAPLRLACPPEATLLRLVSAR